MNISASRIGKLLQYDWMLHRRKAYLGMILISAIFALFLLLYFIFRYVFVDDGLYSGISSHFPNLISQFIAGYFSYATVGVIILTTIVLHFKFTNPRTSVSYLSLPGSTMEKYITLLLNYVIAYAGTIVLYVVLFYVAMGIFKCVYPELAWFAVNPLGLMFSGEASVDNMVSFMSSSDTSFIAMMNEEVALKGDGGVGAAMINFIHAAFRMSFFSTLVALGYFLVLNMCFKRAGILISLAIYIGTMTFIVYATIIISLIFLEDAPEETIATLLNGFAVFFYMMPLLAALLYWKLYRQIKKKQAK